MSMVESSEVKVKNYGYCKLSIRITEQINKNDVCDIYKETSINFIEGYYFMNKF